MKRVAGLLIFLGILLIFFGYYFLQSNLNSIQVKNKLVCSISNSSSNSKFDTTTYYSFVYNNRKVDEFIYKIDRDYSRLSDSEYSVAINTKLCSDISEMFSKKKLDFSKCEERVYNKHLIVETTIDKESNAYKRIGGLDRQKKHLEGLGYSCNVSKEGD